MEEQKKGIQEVVELLDFAELAAVKVIAAGKDGFGLEDLSVLIDSELWSKGKLALEGVGQVGGEFKDLDGEEISLLVSKLFVMAKHIYDVAKAPKLGEPAAPEEMEAPVDMVAPEGHPI